MPALDTLCTFPLQADLFAHAIHSDRTPSPLLALGLATGHVQLHRLPPKALPPDHNASNGLSATIETTWRTRRHNPSCRALTFLSRGTQLLSAGADGLCKLAATETGRVLSKFYIPNPPASVTGDAAQRPNILHALGEQTCLLSTDSYRAEVLLYDLRECSGRIRPAQRHQGLHADYITSITALSSSTPASDPTQVLTTGGTTITILDLRKTGRVLVQSEDQDEELLSSTIIPSRHAGGRDKVVVGGSKGTLRVWDVGVWDDNEVLVRVGRAGCESLAFPSAEDQDSKESILAVGLEDGTIRFVDFTNTMSQQRRVKSDGSAKAQPPPRVKRDLAVTHDEIEPVSCLGWLADGRMVSGGGAVVKIWDRRDPSHISNGVDGGEDEEDDDEEEEEDSESDSDTNPKHKRRKNKKRKRGKHDEGKAGQKKGFMFDGLL